MKFFSPINFLDIKKESLNDSIIYVGTEMSDVPPSPGIVAPTPPGSPPDYTERLYALYNSRRSMIPDNPMTNGDDENADA